MIHQRPVISRISDTDKTDSRPDSWQLELQNAFRDPVELLKYLKISHNLIDTAKITAIPFPMLVPRSFADRMKTGDIKDPLLLQVLSALNELEQHSDYCDDPVGDLDSMVIPGLLHKYHGRVLLTLTGACAIHCRYCFRRHFPYSDATITSSNWTKIIDYIQNDSSITEVILSGGDPLSLSDRRLFEVIQHIESIAHVKYLRFHSRLPVVLPERITFELLRDLESSRLKIIVVIHCNHPNEINSLVEQQLGKLSNAGIRLLNQSVLLRNINDDAITLAELSKKLFDVNVSPYYLHRLDKVSGAQHFDISISRAKTIYLELQSILPGYLIPKFVQELPGLPAKTSYL